MENEEFRRQKGKEQESRLKSDNRKKMDGSPSRGSDYRTCNNGDTGLESTYGEVVRVVR